MAGSSAPSSLERSQSPTKMTYVSEKHPRGCLEAMNELRRQCELCDVVLTVGKRRIYAHRLVLAACSRYFNAMFTMGLVESKLG